MSNILGTNVASLIAPFTTDDTYPTHDSLYGIGGWREVPDIGTRDAIPGARLRIGMAVYVQGDQGYVWTGSSWIALLSSASRTAAICYTINGGGTAITVGSKGQLYIPTACTITGWTITADVAGSAVVDVLTATYAGSGAPTTTSIAGSDQPTLISSTNATSNPLAVGWGTASIAAGTELQFYVDSATTVTILNITLIVTTSG